MTEPTNDDESTAPPGTAEIAPPKLTDRNLRKLRELLEKQRQRRTPDDQPPDTTSDRGND